MRQTCRFGQGPLCRGVRAASTVSTPPAQQRDLRGTRCVRAGARARIHRLDRFIPLGLPELIWPMADIPPQSDGSRRFGWLPWQGECLDVGEGFHGLDNTFLGAIA